MEVLWNLSVALKSLKSVLELFLFDQINRVG